MQGVGDEPLNVIEPERRQHDFLRLCSRLADRGQRPHQRMRRTDFVVAVGSDQQHVPHVRIGNQALQQFQSRRVQPLQIVEEQRQRMLRASEGAEETPEHQLETAPRFLRWQFCHGWLFADDEFDFGYEVDHQLAIRPQRLQKGVPPMVHLGFALNQDLTHQHLECLCQRRVRYVALVLVELACGEKPARRNQHLVQLVHYRRFADTGISGYQYELGGALRHHPIERRKQSIDLALPAVQLLGYQQPVRQVVRAQREWIDAAMRLPFRQAPPKIGFQTRGGLIAVLRVLGEEPHGDGG